MSTQTPAQQDGFKSKWGFIMACTNFGVKTCVLGEEEEVVS